MQQTYTPQTKCLECEKQITSFYVCPSCMQIREGISLEEQESIGKSQMELDTILEQGQEESFEGFDN